MSTYVGSSLTFTGETATRHHAETLPCGCHSTWDEVVIDLGQGDSTFSPCWEHMDAEERAYLAPYLAADAAERIAARWADVAPVWAPEPDPWTDDAPF